MAKCHVYRNLHKNVWSIRYKGTVIAHAEALEVLNADFKVNEAGRKRVLRESTKNVHAFVVPEHITAIWGCEYTGKGDILPLCTIPKYEDVSSLTEWDNRAYYNPYTTPTFQDYDTAHRLYKAKHVSMHNDAIVTYSN